MPRPGHRSYPPSFLQQMCQVSAQSTQWTPPSRLWHGCEASQGNHRSYSIHPAASRSNHWAMYPAMLVPFIVEAATQILTPVENTTRGWTPKPLQSTRMKPGPASSPSAPPNLQLATGLFPKKKPPKCEEDALTAISLTADFHAAELARICPRPRLARGPGPAGPVEGSLDFL